MKGLIHKIKCGTCAYRKQCHEELKEVKRVQEEHKDVLNKQLNTSRAEVEFMIETGEIQCDSCIAQEVCVETPDLSCAELIYLVLENHFKN